MGMKTALLVLLDRLPDRVVPARIREWKDRQVEAMIAEARMDLQRVNWNLVNKLEELKKMAEDPRIPEEKRKEVREKIAEFGERLDAIRAPAAPEAEKKTAGL